MATSPCWPPTCASPTDDATGLVWPPSRAEAPNLQPMVSNVDLQWTCAVSRRYGFVEFDDPRDADDAVYDLNGKELCGERVIVEHTKGPRRDGGYSGRSKYLQGDLLQEQRRIHAGSHSFQGSFALNFRG